LSYIRSEIKAGMGLITLNRPKALNALSLDMVRDLYALLIDWRDNPVIEAVAIRGSNKEGPFGAFCAGGDIRFFHSAGIANDQALEDFFTEEYRLNHLIFTYPKPYIAFMDGIVMGGGMGISQGASIRIVTERSKLAMPETNIGLFPDVGGGYFLSRCAGASGEYLALTGQVMVGADAITLGLADNLADSAYIGTLWDDLTSSPNMSVAERVKVLEERLEASTPAYHQPDWMGSAIDACFAKPSVAEILQALEEQNSSWADACIETLRQRSPLMLHVVLEQIHRARHMTLADDLRMERDLVRHCFYTEHLGRSGVTSETVEGIRALAVDKDHSPKWNPETIENVEPDMVAPFFISPWTRQQHPLADLD
jgi:enoyl-CoA hydratase/carnithine racemase